MDIANKLNAVLSLKGRLVRAQVVYDQLLLWVRDVSLEHTQSY